MVEANRSSDTIRAHEFGSAWRIASAPVGHCEMWASARVAFSLTSLSPSLALFIRDIDIVQIERWSTLYLNMDTRRSQIFVLERPTAVEAWSASTLSIQHVNVRISVAGESRSSSTSAVCISGDATSVSASALTEVLFPSSRRMTTFVEAPMYLYLWGHQHEFRANNEATDARYLAKISVLSSESWSSRFFPMKFITWRWYMSRINGFAAA